MKSKRKYNYDSFDSGELRINDIEPGRSGYVYMLKAEGTPRYKIGRSNNPFKRGEKITVQSPYPLTVVDCFWSPDCVTDENFYHRRFEQYRVYGEYFEFPWRMEFMPHELYSAAPKFIYLTFHLNISCMANGSYILSHLVYSAEKFLNQEYRRVITDDKHLNFHTKLIGIFTKKSSIKGVKDAHNFVYKSLVHQIECCDLNYRGKDTFKHYILGMMMAYILTSGEQDND